MSQLSQLDLTIDVDTAELHAALADVEEALEEHRAAQQSLEAALSRLNDVTIRTSLERDERATDGAERDV